MLKLRCKKPEMKRIIRFIYLRIVRANDSPPRVAAGVAIGVFLGIFPTFGLGLVLAYILAVIFRINKAAAVAGSLIMNPLTTPFFWTLSAILGGTLIGAERDFILEELKSGRIFKAIGPAFYAYMLGNIIISAVFAVVSYFVTLEIIKRHKKV
ncbi:MAG: hypothetical protein A2231_04310 [Candidatus Firestonebacteria bacterium RIFOXYA2_FULL_40_8]|nr:MAG: hypothetical protein A2231_04310 [Candidatus Firestonebacteria bacterium RIFOXYA2_FULL_40_8]